jgi:hypothetical protein
MLKIDFNNHGKKNIIILIPALILAFLIFNKLGFFDNKALKSANYWEQNGLQNIRESLSNSNKLPSLSQPGNKDALIISGKEKPGKFYIITGSYINPENANSVARQFSHNGYNVNIIKVSNNTGNDVQLVSINTFDDKEDADEFLKEFKNNFNSEAWIFHNSDNFNTIR